MASAHSAPVLQRTALFATLLARLREARARTDELFHLLSPDALYDRPIAERHRLIFYRGHLEAFDWNLLSGPLGLTSQDAAIDKLFAFGIDPVDGDLPTDTPADWPSVAQVDSYVRRLQDRLDDALQSAAAFNPSVPTLADGTLLNVAIEHRLMHAETLAYLLHNLPADRKICPIAALPDSRPAPRPVQVAIPSGVATLGQLRGDSQSFGWDNEFETLKIDVPSFLIDVYPVTNGEYLKFIQAGGYENSSYWKPEAWEWVRGERLEHPYFWVPGHNPRTLGIPADDSSSRWGYRAMFGTIPLPLASPACVSHAEASAFARWSGKKLPTEAQWHRAAYGAANETERMYPWGDTPPDGPLGATLGNFHHHRWEATPVDAYPAGASAWRVMDLLGNGWEWTSTVFGPLPGFEPFSFYPGYSANFFDGKHFVMKGGSPRTDACMLRRSFRNWFQPHYPYVYSKFRCVEE